MTRRANLIRGETIPARNAAATHCPRGHPYAGANLYIRSNGTRECRECTRARDRARYAKDPKRRYRYVPRARQVATHCKRGHEFTPDNTITKRNGTRRCRICVNVYQKARRDRVTSMQASQEP